MKEPSVATLSPCHDHRDAVSCWFCCFGHSVCPACLWEPSWHSPPHPHLHSRVSIVPILRLVWVLFGYFGYFTSWMFSGHIMPSATSNLSMSSHQFYIKSWNNGRAMSVCFILWGNEGVEIVPKTPCQCHWQLRSQAKIGRIKGVHGSDLVLGRCSLAMAKGTSSWSCALHISAVLHWLIKTEPWESESPFCLFMSAKICKKIPLPDRQFLFEPIHLSSVFSISSPALCLC